LVAVSPESLQSEDVQFVVFALIHKQKLLNLKWLLSLETNLIFEHFYFTIHLARFLKNIEAKHF
jgi:hypothetical protein